MATLCKNCGHALIFDPSIQKVRCEQCGSTFRAEEVESESKKYAEEQRVLAAEEVYGVENTEAAKEFLDCYIYTCSECGGEIMINGTEASTKCVYCGNPTVVFSRISKQECPQFIIPFSITKEQAIQNINEAVGHGLFVPSAVKHFTPDSVHGIYIPFWLVDVDRSEAMIIKKRTSYGQNSSYTYHGRAGTMEFQSIPIDGCTMLSDESSMRLEPYDFKKLVPFDEDYLLGFYSNVSDLTYGDLNKAMEKRTSDMFEEYVLDSISSGTKTIVSSRSSISIHPDLRYVLLPAWFVTFEYEGKHNTILVNGQTGKVVCGLPMRRVLFYTLLIASCVILTALLTFGFYHVIRVVITAFSRSSSSNNNGTGKLFGLIIVAGCSMAAAGFRMIKNVFSNLKLTQSTKTFNFTKKRQE